MRLSAYYPEIFRAVRDFLVHKSRRMYVVRQDPDDPQKVRLAYKRGGPEDGFPYPVMTHPTSTVVDRPGGPKTGAGVVVEDRHGDGNWAVWAAIPAENNDTGDGAFIPGDRIGIGALNSIKGEWYFPVAGNENIAIGLNPLTVAPTLALGDGAGLDAVPYRYALTYRVNVRTHLITADVWVQPGPEIPIIPTGGQGQVHITADVFSLASDADMLGLIRSRDGAAWELIHTTGGTTIDLVDNGLAGSTYDPWGYLFTVQIPSNVDPDTGDTDPDQPITLPQWWWGTPPASSVIALFGIGNRHFVNGNPEGTIWASNVDTYEVNAHVSCADPNADWAVSLSALGDLPTGQAPRSFEFWFRYVPDCPAHSASWSFGYGPDITTPGGLDQATTWYMTGGLATVDAMTVGVIQLPRMWGGGPSRLGLGWTADPLHSDLDPYAVGSTYPDVASAGYVDADGGPGWVVPSTLFTDGDWHHIAITYDGCYQVELFVDGVSQEPNGLGAYNSGGVNDGSIVDCFNGHHVTDASYQDYHAYLQTGSGDFAGTAAYCDVKGFLTHTAQMSDDSIAHSAESTPTDRFEGGFRGDVVNYLIRDQSVYKLDYRGNITFGAGLNVPATSDVNGDPTDIHLAGVHIDPTTNTTSLPGTLKTVTVDPPPVPAAGEAVTYTKDVGGAEHPMFKGSDGVEYDLTAPKPSQLTPLGTESGGDVVTFNAGTGQYEPSASAGGGGGLYSGYLLYQDQKASGTGGGTFTSGAWRTRDINTEVVDAGGHGSVASNQITLDAGTYDVRIEAPAYFCDRHAARLYDITNSAVLLSGRAMYSNTSSGDENTSLITGRIILSGTTVLEVQHQCQTSAATLGFGVQAGTAFTVGTEIYTTAEFWRV
jgi:hypothetical protein